MSELVFLCHSWADKPDVECLAAGLRSVGVEVWYDDWCISPGDSLRRKIDDGLGRATHFVVVLSPRSLRSEWVQTELDTALVQKISGACRLIPVLHGIDNAEVPATLRGIRWIRWEGGEGVLQELLGVVLGLPRGPSLGPRPRQLVAKSSESNGLSPDARCVAEAVWSKATAGHPLFGVGYDDLMAEVALADAAFEMAVDELLERGLLSGKLLFRKLLMPTWQMFFELDGRLGGSEPEKDAAAVAAVLVNCGLSASSEQLAARLGWGARRLNPALAFLRKGEIVDAFANGMGGDHFYNLVRGGARTKRFVRDQR